MKNNTILLVLLILGLGLFVAIGGYLLFVRDGDESNEETNTQSQATTQTEDNAQAEETPTNMESESDESSTSGVYADYSETTFDEHSNKTRILFFHAKWCPSCRELDETIEADEDDIPSDVAIFKVDYDDEVSLKQEYGVTLQQTLVVVDENGNEVDKWNSLYQESELSEVLDHLN
ncbi:hypothetical protein GF389_03800 [Candidatus Dojkabacteria bacterium]|nr:hypothetical protein [Candidatus Dojkabacteria bacterium]